MDIEIALDTCCETPNTIVADTFSELAEIIMEDESWDWGSKLWVKIWDQSRKNIPRYDPDFYPGNLIRIVCEPFVPKLSPNFQLSNQTLPFRGAIC